jgi:hypothetical protein
MATDQQRQGDYNPEYMEQGPIKTIGGADHYGNTNLSEFETDPAHPTSPSSVQQYNDGTRPYVKDVRDDPPGDTPGSDGAGGSITMENDAEAQAEAFLKREAWLVAKAQEIYTTSTDYMDANITNQWERNLSHFNNEHAPSNRLSNRKLRHSRVFRPKTRTMTKSHEAALTNAMFTTQDVIDIQAEDSTDTMQIVSAKINKEILQYRLDRRMRWFQTTIGAYQSTKVYGLCISFQYWDYHEDSDITPAVDKDGMLMQDEDGNALGYMETKVRRDELKCDGIAPENFRFDPMCDWRDPCGTSPYLVYMMPVYVGQALENMEKIDQKTGQPLWRKHSMGSILATRRKNYDRTRQAREGRDRIDPADEQHGNAYTMLWAHMNIVTVNGDDILFWTMGTELLLTEPMLLTDAFPHLREGERPFVVGFSTIEAFRNYPAGDVEQSAPIQQEINTVANQRLDNVKLALNKRYYVKRGSQVDLDALIRNVPGGGVMMNDPEADVKTIETKDITGSSYQEQDRLSTEMDELVGSFSQQSVQQTGNRKGGETKGGMDAMRSGAGAVQDYGIKIFVETWAEPTLRQLVRLEQMYENDEHIIALAGKKAEAYQRFKVSEITDEILRADVTTRINVGMNNTDPQARIDKLLYGVESTAKLPGMAGKLKSEEVSAEIFGMLGYRDASRFYRDDAEQTQYAEEHPPEIPAEIQLKDKELQIRDNDNKARHQREVMKLDKEARYDFAKLAIEKGFKYDDMMTKLGVSLQDDKTKRDVAAASNVTKLDEHRLKRQTGSGV